MEESVWDVNKAFPFILVAVAIVITLICAAKRSRSPYDPADPVTFVPERSDMYFPRSKSFFADRPVRVMSGGRPGIGLGDTPPAAFDVSTGEISLGF